MYKLSAAVALLLNSTQAVSLTKKVPRLGEADRDPWVYQFGLDTTAAADGLRRPDEGINYGWHPANIFPQPPAWGSYGADSAAQPK